MSIQSSRESVLCLIRALPVPERQPRPDAFCYACGWEHARSCVCTLFAAPLTIDDAVVSAQIEVNRMLGLGLAPVRWTESTAACAQELIDRLQRTLNSAREYSPYLAA